MKNVFVFLLLIVSTVSFGQNIEKEKLWRTKGVYDSLGNFIERAKIQSFLVSTNSKEFHRLQTQDKINMETGETKVFVYRDTLRLVSLGKNHYQASDKEVLTLHSKDSLTITFKGYTLPYVKLSEKANSVDLEKLKAELINTPFVETVADVNKYQLTYQDTNLVKVHPLESSSEWESDYKIIDFDGFIIIQGIVSAPKLITKLKKGEVYFLEIDYRFENKKGKLTKSN
ncbi:hypothetical protein [Kordia zhangzhouensis]|uniref:hypothetical protein n=1 Tax=Kordia zhangzhouensis TaxID=1620405 RepID=UPI0006296711|nr:hypothetical protein [Kordia zhangzhouensis]